MKQQQPKPIDPEIFHAHLDKCDWCRKRPFNLCPVGMMKGGE